MSCTVRRAWRGKKLDSSADVDEFRQQSPELPMIHLDLRSFGSEHRSLTRCSFGIQILLQGSTGITTSISTSTVLMNASFASTPLLLC